MLESDVQRVAIPAENPTLLEIENWLMPNHDPARVIETEPVLAMFAELSTLKMKESNDTT